jgi:hypothetical protein
MGVACGTILPEGVNEAWRNDTYGVARDLLHRNVRNKLLRLPLSRDGVTRVSNVMSAGGKSLRDLIRLRAD